MLEVYCNALPTGTVPTCETVKIAVMERLVTVTVMSFML